MALRAKSVALDSGIKVLFIATFFILSLGPRLKLIEHPTSVILPLVAFIRIPFLSFARDPVRFSLYVMMGTLILLGIWLEYMRREMPKQRYRIFFASVVCMMIAERLIIPFPLTFFASSPFYKTLQQDQERYAILDIPLGAGMEQRYNLLQTIHHKPIMHGYVQHTAFREGNTDVFIQQDAFLQTLACWPFQNQDNLPTSTSSEQDRAKKTYLRHQIRYIILHKQPLQAPRCAGVYAKTRKYFHAIPRVYTDHSIEVLRVDQL